MRLLRLHFVMTPFLRTGTALFASLALLGAVPQPSLYASTAARSACLLKTRFPQDNKDDHNKDNKDDKDKDNKKTDDNKDDKKKDDKKKDDTNKDNPFSAEEQKLNDHVWGVVVANQHGVVGVPVAAGGLSPLQRAQTVAARMGRLYQEGVKFRDPKNYVVGQFNGQVVLGVRVPPASGGAASARSGEDKPGEEKVELLFTIDTNLLQYMTQGKNQKPLTRADIASGWCGLLIKALQENTEIGVPPTRHTKHEWASVQAGAAHGKAPVRLRASQVRAAHP